MKFSLDYYLLIVFLVACIATWFEFRRFLRRGAEKTPTCYVNPLSCPYSFGIIFLTGCIATFFYLLVPIFPDKIPPLRAILVGLSITYLIRASYITVSGSITRFGAFKIYNEMFLSGISDIKRRTGFRRNKAAIRIVRQYYKQTDFPREMKRLTLDLAKDIGWLPFCEKRFDAIGEIIFNDFNKLLNIAVIAINIIGKRQLTKLLNERFSE